MTHPRQSVGTHVDQPADCLGTVPALGLKLGGDSDPARNCEYEPTEDSAVTALQAERLGKWPQ